MNIVRDGKTYTLTEEEVAMAHAEFRIENNKIYSNNGLCERTDIFEIVNKIPVGFFVWNIGENMGSDEYIPLAQDLKPAFS